MEKIAMNVKEMAKHSLLYRIYPLRLNRTPMSILQRPLHDFFRHVRCLIASDKTRVALLALCGALEHTFFFLHRNGDRIVILWFPGSSSDLFVKNDE